MGDHLGGPDPERDERGGLLRGLRAVAVCLEPALVLFVALGVATLASAPLIPRDSRLAFPLRPAAALERPADEFLLERARALGVAERVDILLMRGGDHLVFDRPAEREQVVRDVQSLLEANGYRRADPSESLPADIGALFEGRPTRLAAMLSLQALALLVAALVMLRTRVRPALALRAGPTRVVVEGLLAGLASLLASAAISTLLASIGLPVEEQAWLERLFADRAAWLPIVPWLVLIGPVAEELFFRGYLLRFVRQELGLNSALVISSVLFAAIHTNLTGVPIYLAIGGILGYVYHRTGTVLAPIIAHALLNAVALAVSTGTLAS